MKLSGKACNSVFQGPGSDEASEGPQQSQESINSSHFTTFNSSVTGCLTTSVSSRGSNRETNFYKMKVLGIRDPDIKNILSCKILKLKTEKLFFFLSNTGLVDIYP